LLRFLLASVTRYGPRYYYEGIYGLTLASAAGLTWLAGSLKSSGWHRLRALLVVALVSGLGGYNLATYLPDRFRQIYGLYDCALDGVKSIS